MIMYIIMFIYLLQECESSVPIDYLTKLHDEYILFCEEMKYVFTCTCIHVHLQYVCKKKFILY